MDEANREEFKWKFYRLAIYLNIVVILVAAAVIILFRAPSPIKLPLAAVLFLLAAVLAMYFRRRYLATKAWLTEHAKPDEGGDPGTPSGDHAGKG
jgi:membrane protein implicated in regulation of membrane protease activity